MPRNQKEQTYPIKDIETFFEQIINLNLDVENNIFKKLTFKDPFLEKKFQEFSNDDEKKKRIFADVILITGNIVSIIYVLLFLNRLEMIILFSVNLILSCLISRICHYKKNFTKVGYLLDHLNVFINNSSLVIKAFLVIFNYSEDFEAEKLNVEMLRIIIYHFLFINLVILLKFDASFLTFTVYFVFNLFITILAIIYAKKKGTTFEFEACVSFGFTYLMFTFRKIFENLSRMIYSERYKFEKLYKYTTHLIKGLDHNYIVLKNDKTIFINEKFSQDLEKEEIMQNITKNKNNNILNYVNNTYNNVQSDIDMSSNEINKLNNQMNYEEILKELNLIEDQYQNFKDREYNKSYKIIKELKENNLWKMIKEIKEKNLIKTNNFFQLGIFKFDKININKYYTILIRKHDVDCYIDPDFNSDLKEKDYLDIIFLDVSNLLMMEKKFFEENLIKERVIAKLTHELKTPINSIMGLINILNEKKELEKNDSFYDNENKNDKKKLRKQSSIKRIC
jgi:hypothetical protein